jgi:hypothetical protein
MRSGQHDTYLEGNPEIGVVMRRIGCDEVGFVVLLNGPGYIFIVWGLSIFKILHPNLT